MSTSNWGNGRCLFHKKFINFINVSRTGEGVSLKSCFLSSSGGSRFFPGVKSEKVGSQAGHNVVEL